ncbi:carbon-nitrogen hydrolase [Leptospira gomenensis]|uniref:Carbon-nitrogen hydrolase n=1 Tax=Leptospira gomenensis TaxID=2484974 RepID=A0A5F1Z2B2_9LEPT|nr:nitrilase-related carbon-nitrogen hydrolase [Leptospira gomenensis]TGK28993.1 carbon-nitrogen hydrolase [Leptospira gomenensis]TGK32816.1 carbon-nitrogen hydrolase [Leptospira gomenensis]TGK40752.1 carbon-nitrogen hydrolase [Leptospira gomenensis]TGK68404.1 carbon-nitrogen hydrolase [Leptospira gomenensis]
MNSVKRYSLFALIVLIVSYILWSVSDRNSVYSISETRLDRIVSEGKDQKKGNLLGISPWMIPSDYSSETAFREKLEFYFRKAEEKGWLDTKTVAVLPEYLGTWLVVANEKSSVYRSASIEEAMQTLVLSNLGSFTGNLVSAKGKDKIRDAVFRMKAETMLTIYRRTFSNLAKRYGITIVAGSILLPEPTVTEGVLKIGTGELRNGSFVFFADGTVSGNSPHKLYPIEEEKSFVSGASPESLQAVETPVGNIGVLVCADSWYPGVYKTFKKQNIKYVLVPSFVSPNGAMSGIWKGYNGSETPKDVNPKDIGVITEGKAWLKYALAGRMTDSGASYGINVFLRGSLWDLGSDGETILVRGADVKTFPKSESGSLVNVWID